jgi:4-hydroxy-L-threonine phosphate dehydrogenase PdxA
LPAVFFKSNRAFLFVTNLYQVKYFELLKKHFFLNIVTTTSLDFDLWDFSTKSKKPVLNFIVATDSPADWILNLAKICFDNSTTTALVTGPLSKTLIKDAGYSFIGHTEILAYVSKTKSLYMGFVGKYFNVILLTGHVPLNRVSKELKKTDWKSVFEIIHSFRKGLPQRKKPVAMVGVNPHAGEKGMISAGEEDYLLKQIKLDKSGLNIQGPLVPDAAFLKANWGKYSVYLCPYHDQGLIPFKTIHGQDSGVHVTLGLPFVRTSVDHGTAKELFDKNLANPNSMKEALLLAERLLP